MELNGAQLAQVDSALKHIDEAKDIAQAMTRWNVRMVNPAIAGFHLSIAAQIINTARDPILCSMPLHARLHLADARAEFCQLLWNRIDWLTKQSRP